MKSVNQKRPLTVTAFGVESFTVLQNIVEETHKRIEISKQYLASVSGTIKKSDCFVPDAWTYLQPQKLFPLVPQYSMQLKYTTIDIQTLHYLLKGTSIQITLPKTVQEATMLFKAVFTLPAATMDNIGENTKVVFMNTIATDGVGISLCARRPAGKDRLPDLELSDFITEDLKNFHLWAIDPGFNEIFVAVDGHNQEPHQVRKIAAREFYHLAGYDLTNTKICKWKQKAGIDKLESGIPSAKTASPAVFDQHVKGLLDRLGQLLVFYGTDIASLRFENYKGRQRACSEMTNIMLNGGQKYTGVRPNRRRKKRKRGKSKKRKRQKWRRYLKRSGKSSVRDNEMSMKR